MDALTNYTEGKFRGVLRGVTWTAPAGFFIGLYNITPTDIGGGTYIVDADRLPIVFEDTGTSLQNAAAITWPTASAAWGEVAAWGIFDGSTGGSNLVWYGTFDDPVTVGIGDTYEIPANVIELTIT